MKDSLNSTELILRRAKAAYADMIVMNEVEEKAADGSVVMVPDMIMVTIKSTDGKQTTLRPQEFKKGLYEALEYSMLQISFFNKKKANG